MLTLPPVDVVIERPAGLEKSAREQGPLSLCEGCPFAEQDLSVHSEAVIGWSCHLLYCRLPRSKRLSASEWISGGCP